MNLSTLTNAALNTVIAVTLMSGFCQADPAQAATRMTEGQCIAAASWDLKVANQANPLNKEANARRWVARVNACRKLPKSL
jgi:hypothetical protein